MQNGATTLAETFLFVVGAGLVLGESYRSSRKEGKRRDEVHDRLEGLEGEMRVIRSLLEGGGGRGNGLEEARERYVPLLGSFAKGTGLKSGVWADMVSWNMCSLGWWTMG